MRPGLARIEYRHFIVFEEGGLSAYAAVLTECAGDQGAFWEFHDRFAAADSRLFEWEYALGYAGELGLNVVEFRGCMVNRDHLPTVEAMHVGWLGVGGAGDADGVCEWGVGGESVAGECDCGGARGGWGVRVRGRVR